MAQTIFPDMGKDPVRNRWAGGWRTTGSSTDALLSALTWFLDQVESTPASRPKTHVEKVRRRAAKIAWPPVRAHVTPECACVTAASSGSPAPPIGLRERKTCFDAPSVFFAVFCSSPHVCVDSNLCSGRWFWQVSKGRCFYFSMRWQSLHPSAMLWQRSTRTMPSPLALQKREQLRLCDFRVPWWSVRKPDTIEFPGSQPFHQKWLLTYFPVTLTPLFFFWDLPHRPVTFWVLLWPGELSGVKWRLVCDNTEPIAILDSMADGYFWLLGLTGYPLPLVTVWDFLGWLSGNSIIFPFLWRAQCCFERTSRERGVESFDSINEPQLFGQSPRRFL